MLSVPRTFKRLDISPTSYLNNCSGYYPFFLEQFAYKIWNNKLPFASGPAIIAEPSNNEYRHWEIAKEIERCLHYYMKPYNMLVYVDNDIHNTKKSHILTRGWLNITQKENNAIVIMERINLPEDKKYMIAINNSAWRPNNWNNLKKSTNLEQNITEHHNEYTKIWKVDIKPLN
jgi:hypothetical protein